MHEKVTKRLLSVYGLVFTAGVFAVGLIVLGLDQLASRSGSTAVEPGCGNATCCFETHSVSSLLSAGFAPPLVKIYIEAPFCQPGQIKSSGYLSLAGNEYESTQLVLLATDNLPGVSVTVQPLRSVADTQGASDLRTDIRVVGYVSQHTPKVAGNRVGWQPDPLLPDQTLDLIKGQPAIFLLTVQSQQGAKPGLYKGRIELRAQGELIGEKDLLVKVWAFDLPAKSRFKTASFPNYGIIDALWPAKLGFAPASPDAKLSRFKKLADMGFRHRLPPLGYLANGLDSYDWRGASKTRIGFPLYRSEKADLVFDRDTADKLIDYLKVNNANHFFIAFTSDIYKEPGLSGQRERTLLRYLNEYHAYLKEKNLLDQVYVYNIDEPWGESVEHAKRIYKLIKAHFGNELSIMQNANQDNAEIIGQLTGYFDVLDINLGFYDINKVDRYRKRHPEDFSEIWWNLNLWPDRHPNLFVEYPLIDARILGPMSYKHRIQGFEYWHLTALHGVRNYYPLSSRETRVDWQVGENSLDGLLVYPNVDYGYYSSLRLENFRDGMEDQEYLFLLEDLDPGHRLLSVPVVRSIDDYETDTEVYLAFRRQLAEAIEGLSGQGDGAVDP